ncbi:MAG: SDR family oxidoreductase [Gemmatimonadota bacterium]
MAQQRARNIAAIVTGHSRGLGAGIAAALLQRGVRVLGLARKPNVKLARDFADRLTEVRIDLADFHALTAWLDEATLAPYVRGADIALLVNNAGVLQPLGPLSLQRADTVFSAVAVNVGAALALSAAFAAASEDVPDRRIMHISSGAGRRPYGGWSVYCASKAALDHHARTVALDQTPGLRISSLAPGVIDTDMQAEIRATSDGIMPERQRFVELKREGRLTSSVTAGRGAVDFLLSDSFGSEPVADLR